MGFECRFGTPNYDILNWDFCFELCGDAKNMGSHTVTMAISPLVTDVMHSAKYINYNGGTGESWDRCTEACGDGFNVGYLPCDDYNLLDNDGCTSLCYVETGYNCTGGDINNRDYCMEVCGDGITLDNYWCDDGNNVMSDGCDEWCNVEFGWFCGYGTFTNPSRCWKIS